VPVRELDPAAATAREAFRESLGNGMSPDDVAGLVVDAVREERFWILTDQRMAASAVDRAEGIISGANPRSFRQA
jgi:hypothetical protein